MPHRYAYRAGIAHCVVTDAPEFIEYDCGPLQSGRIEKAWITAVGISDDRYLTDFVAGGAAMQKLLGVKDGLGGLLIAYAPPGATRPRLATITFDFGDEGCRALVAGVTKAVGDRFVGTGTRGELMKRMNVSRTRENLIIAAVLGLVAVVAFLLTIS